VKRVWWGVKDRVKKEKSGGLVSECVERKNCEEKKEERKGSRRG
jgi:hypothetical protein